MLTFGERFLGYVAENHRVVGLELGQIGGKRIAADATRAVNHRGDLDSDLDFLLACRRPSLHQLGVLSACSFDQEYLGLPPWRVRVNASAFVVVDRPTITRCPCRV